MNILIPNTTKEEIEAIFEFARCGANNSMIGIHKEIIQITDEDFDKILTNCSTWNIPPKKEQIMTNKECIHDLKAIREDFEKRCGFCTPVCLDKAINIIENLEHIQAELDRAKSLLERKPAKWQESVFRHRTPSTCTTIHGFECSECHAFSHLKSKYCSDCGSFMENWI